MSSNIAPAVGEQARDIESFLKQNEEKELLRFSTAGSVDDGKSTLIGRLLYDSKGVYEDQIASVKRASVNHTAGIMDFALLTDGLRAEREQGITIDVAYRYFSTPKRKFIIADTPGHEQYTRNMATGASTANLAIILVDARNGVLAQSRRHAFIASLLGIPHLIVAVNKMDLVDFSESVFESIRAEFTSFMAQLQITDVHFIPISALLGDNVVEKSGHMPWFQGSSLLHYLETVHIAADRNFSEMRFPVQYVTRPNQDFRGYAGQLASGVIRKGDPVMALPSGNVSRIKSIVTYDGELSSAFPPMSVTVCLEDEVDVSRGDMLVPPLHAPHVSRWVDARLVWMDTAPLDLSRQYLIKHTTQISRAQAASIRYRIDVNSLEKQPADKLALNEIGAVVLETHRPLFFDPYKRNRATGCFILIDPITNLTVAAGMITGREPHEIQHRAVLKGIRLERGRIGFLERQTRFGHRAFTVWLSGGEELAYRLERKLFDRGCLVNVLCGQTDTATLAGWAKMANATGLISICIQSAGTPQDRDWARKVIGEALFVDVDSETLPRDEDEAVAEICRNLETRGFIREHEPLGGGAGI